MHHVYLLTSLAVVSKLNWPGLVEMSDPAGILKYINLGGKQMSKSNKVTGVLLASKRRIARRWAKGAWKKERDARDARDGFGKNSYCLEGSCTGGSKIPSTPAQSKAMEYILKAIKERTGSRYTSIPSYNDSPLTTQDDVNAVVARAYEMAKADGL